MGEPSGNKALQLLNHIVTIAGIKILTLLLEETGEIKFDIDDDGNVGYDPMHKHLLLAELNSGFSNGGVVIIRQFTPLKTEIINAKNKKMWVPIKNVYGLILRDHQWIAVSKKELRESFSIDAQTGKPLKREPDVAYQDIPAYFFESV